MYTQALGRESGSANSGRPKQYAGSRSAKHRYAYSDNSYAGFVELQPAFAPEPSEFFEMLKAVPNVEKVAWNTKKTSQGNVGKHYCEQNMEPCQKRFSHKTAHFHLNHDGVTKLLLGAHKWAKSYVGVLSARLTSLCASQPLRKLCASCLGRVHEMYWTDVLRA